MSLVPLSISPKGNLPQTPLSFFSVPQRFDGFSKPSLDASCGKPGPGYFISTLASLSKTSPPPPRPRLCNPYHCSGWCRQTLPTLAFTLARDRRRPDNRSPRVWAGHFFAIPLPTCVFWSQNRTLFSLPQPWFCVRLSIFMPPHQCAKSLNMIHVPVSVFRTAGRPGRNFFGWLFSLSGFLLAFFSSGLKPLASGGVFFWDCSAISYLPSRHRFSPAIVGRSPRRPVAPRPRALASLSLMSLFC